MNLKEKVITEIKKIYDPEIPVNIYELGLIYDIVVGEMADGKKYSNITMSLTSAFCPAADMIVNDVKGAALTVDDVIDCQVEVTFNPPWDPSRLTEEGHAYLNYMYSDRMD